MCGRTALCLSRDQLQCACSFKIKGSSTYTKPNWLPEHNDGKEYTPSYNITPTEVTPVLMSPWFLKDEMFTQRVLKPMVWGVIPPWHKGDYNKHGLSTHNCKLETIQTSKLYGPILKNGGRCVIVIEGFYEWKTRDSSKQPYYIYAPQHDDLKMDDRSTWTNTWSEEEGWKGVNLLHIAGIFNMWQDSSTGTVIYSYAVITMESNDTLNWLHHRMPAVLNTQEQIDIWLDTDNVNSDLAVSYLKPVKLLSWYPVSTAVNKSTNKSSDCNKRRILKPQSKSITAWFKPVGKR